MNVLKAMDTLTDRVRQIGISEFGRRINRAKGTIHGILEVKCRKLTLQQAATWFHAVGLHVEVMHDKHNNWDKIAVAAVRQAEQHAAKKPKPGTQLKLPKAGAK